MKPIAALVVLVLLCASPAIANEEPMSETPEQFANRTQWWRDARFGMFIHWGVYAVPADDTDHEGKHRIAEWYLDSRRMQVHEYEKFAARFNPVDFDARAWVRLAKEAGMKYIVITSKHHDGFAMFDTKLTDWNIIKATPFGRDPLKELADACEEAGIVLCFYYSILDWHHPDYLPRRKWEAGVRDDAGADFNRYVDYMKGQLTELLTNYGKVGGIWFDGWWEHDAEKLRSAEVNAMIRRLQPHILINDRNRLKEDYDTPEQKIPERAPEDGRLWETCMTMNKTWGFAKNDHDWKPTEDLVRKLIDIASKGGNFLLNVGPDDLGRIPEPSVERLQAVGRWLSVNGEAIYGTSASPFESYEFDGRCTTKGNKLYVHVFDWPEDRIKIFGIVSPMVSARWLNGQDAELQRRSADGVNELTILKPGVINPAATVLEITFTEPVRVEVSAQP